MTPTDWPSTRLTAPVPPISCHVWSCITGAWLTGHATKCASMLNNVEHVLSLVMSGANCAQKLIPATSQPCKEGIGLRAHNVLALTFAKTKHR